MARSLTSVLQQVASLTFGCCFLGTGCTLDVSLLDGSSITTAPNADILVLDQNNLDLDFLSHKVSAIDSVIGGQYTVQISMEDYVYQNKVKFKNLPLGAQLHCSGIDGSTALQAYDLSNDRSFNLKPYYWVSTSPEWESLQRQVFSCWYEISGVRSNSIQFEISLKEASIIRASIPDYTGSESLATSWKNGAFSGDGKFLVFSTTAPLKYQDQNSIEDVYMYSVETQEYTLVSKGTDGYSANAASYEPTISADGNYIAFISKASNLVPGDTNDNMNVFIYNRQSQTISRISETLTGGLSDGRSYAPTISGDGRYVAYESDATNIVNGDTNWSNDIFLHDQQTSQTIRVSVATDASEADSYSYRPSISGDGRYIAFVSEASNLVPSDTNWDWDIFVHDRLTSTTTRVSVDSSGNESNGWSDLPKMSSNGRYVVYESGASNLILNDSNSTTDIFLFDRQTLQTTRISTASNGTEANSMSRSPSISGDGRYVTFESLATNLVSGDTNSVRDVFLVDRVNSITTRISLDENGNEKSTLSKAAFISSGGQVASYESGALFLYDTQINSSKKISREIPGPQSDTHSQGQMDISNDGRFIAFPSSSSNFFDNDASASNDIFIHDRKFGTTKLVTARTDNNHGTGFVDSKPSISGDGNLVAFSANSANFVVNDTNSSYDVFVRDLVAGHTKRVSVSTSGTEGNGHSRNPQISKNGRYVIFESTATNLVAGDTNGVSDIFLHDLQNDTTTRVSVDDMGAQANGASNTGTISDDGSFIAFVSLATNLVAGDTNGFSDIFVKNVVNGTVTRASISSLGAQSNAAPGSFPQISSDGQFIVFSSNATNLVASDTNASSDIFVHDRILGTTSRVSIGTGGVEANSSSDLPSISGNGQFIVFRSSASNLSANDSNSADDIFVHDRQTSTTRIVSIGFDGASANRFSQYSNISRDGRYIAFDSDADNILPLDFNYSIDVFVKRNPFQ